MHVSDRKALGTGVLVGTSLIVIIPEGVETLYAAGGDGHGHAERMLARDQRRDFAAGDSPWVHHIGRRDDSPVSIEAGAPAHMNVGFVADPHDTLIARQDTAPESAPQDEGSKDGPASQDNGDDSSESHHDPHAWVGLSLIAGFALMYLIDTLPRHANSPSQPRRFSISLNSFSFNRTSTDNNAAPETPPQATFSSSRYDESKPSASTTTTLGLLIHALADGIALGASSGTANGTNRLTFIIFLALMLHKAPAAFGLTSVLLKQGLSKRMARTHLTLFALAAPVGALGTWVLAHLFAGRLTGSQDGAGFATGVLLLFSGGTFLYVAVHTMMESGGAGGGHVHGEGQGNGYLGVSSGMEEEDGVYGQSAMPLKSEGPGLVDTAVTVGGMLLPLLLTGFGHGH
ncbi:hypothetical protein LTR91_009598 [Friedmanniomyces endolithicus]|uniref:Zinc/iron permease n=2 Tax=Friedmanniomyces endolithicus TaxID=329885 RepID=A0AAN6KL27_9PEZI|nr:hypothetical protein LTS09_017076 [Friedmanniomyces endolithicus]KAK0278969.1 hypothetical protein LTS00_013581 [Friedmanniomyces endolithicus]KAK0279529.1 hypothetical protein LTR35_008719 [Friedmanniomyces endolithicus]KAK0303884.1 hypothetical protein LTR01_007745 [Friedmanniomyces endolithicus]KAK0320908.1 hypothetical protein LTR82_008227 [Friedmanniomyces endolithicus]